MNPLIITRRFGKLVDPMLVDDDPFGQADLFALQRLRVVYGFDDYHGR
jgi:hypothetical protein